MLYLLFVAVAFVFWGFLSLDTEVQRDFDIPTELTDVPDSITIIGHLPPTLSVSVRGKDSQLLRFIWGGMSPLKFKWHEYVSGHSLVIPRLKLEGRLREYFGNGVSIASCRPDSIRLQFTDLPGVRVKLEVMADVRPNLQYIISGPIRSSADSVTLYSVADLPHTLKVVATEPLHKSGLKDTTRFTVRVKPIAGVRIIPDEVTVTVPVEPLIARKRSVRIEALNIPDHKNLVTFPSKVEISYLVPMSSYNTDYPIKAFVDFRQIRSGRHKLPVSVSVSSDKYSNVSFAPDSVDYIIETIE